MKKITIFALHLNYGGIEKCISSLANSLCDEYDIEIISTYKLSNKPAFDINNKVKIKYLTLKKPNRDSWKKAIKSCNPIRIIKETIMAINVLKTRKNLTIKAIKSCNSDIIISSRVLFNNWVGKYAKEGIYKIAWEHNHHHNNKKYINSIIKSIKNIDALVLVSKELKEFYEAIINKNNYSCKCYYIPNSLDFITEKQSNLKSKKIITVGRLVKEKGYLDLIEVFSDFNKSNPDWELNIIGDGPLKDTIKNKIVESNLQDKVFLHGYLNKKQIEKLMLDSSIYVMSSYTESFGLVLIEAMSYGLPCIAFSSAEGANDIIVNNKNGYLIKDRNHQKMVNKINMLADDYELRIKMGSLAKKQSLNYDISKTKKEWLKVFNKND